MILFLDFDGVLHPDRAEVDQLFSCAPILEKALRDFPAVRVVISSSWREAHSLYEMREFFSPDIAARIMDVTPSAVPTRELPGKLWGFVREAECFAWINRHHLEGIPWIAVDDQAWRFRPGCENLLLTDPGTGFSYEDAQTLRQRLGAALTRQDGSLLYLRRWHALRGRGPLQVLEPE